MASRNVTAALDAHNAKLDAMRSELTVQRWLMGLGFAALSAPHVDGPARNRGLRTATALARGSACQCVWFQIDALACNSESVRYAGSMPFGDEARFEREFACQDCGQTQTRHTREAWPTGAAPRVCKACQNARYLAKLSPQRLEHRKQRKALLAKRRRIELKIQKAQAELRSVGTALDNLGQNAQNGA